MQLLDALSRLDESIFRALNQAGSNQLLDDIMVLFTVLGLSFVIVLLCVPLWGKGRHDLAFDVAILVVLATVVSELIKVIVDRPRPPEVLSNVHTIMAASGASFPSGHATRAFAVTMILALQMSRSTGTSAVLVAFMIALSRVYLGVHWPSDVLAGALLGISLAFAIKHLGDSNDPYKWFRSAVVRRIEEIVHRAASGRN